MSDRDERAERAHSIAGLILLDSSQRPVYFSTEAMQLLAYPRKALDMKSLDGVLAREIRSKVRANRNSDRPGVPFEVTSGKRHYVCRAFSLTGSPGSSFQPMTAILIERNSGKSIDLSEAVERFHLTDRERQTVELLMLGLTSKEIAAQMKISPNTVKAFLRLIMTKMGVFTRSGIVGRIMRTSP